MGERALLIPSHCARLVLGGGKSKSDVNRIIVQPSTKRIHHDARYEDAGYEISEDLSECGLIIGIKQPELEMILPDRAYAFFSHTHKAQKENMLLLDKIKGERVSLFDYELIVDDDGKIMLAFGDEDMTTIYTPPVIKGEIIIISVEQIHEQVSH